MRSEEKTWTTANPELRFVQLTPIGSARPQIVVADAHAAHDELAGRGIEVSDVEELPWGKFGFFADPDGNRWSLQELPPR